MEHRIQVEFNARYEVLGTPSEQIEELWFVCHGHGQLARFFIKKFECINDGKTLIVAPEGLYRYYLNGFTGRVGATWMTKEDRLSDINNYLNYLTAVYLETKKQLSPQIKTTLFGFSQGAATISRFATQTKVDFHKLILWAGILPPDLPTVESTDKLSDKKTYFVMGDNDPYASQQVIEEQEKLAQQIKVTPERITFEGEHELYEKVIAQIRNDNSTVI